MIPNTNDGTNNPPYLRLDLNYWNCHDLPDFSTGPKGDDRQKHQAIKAAGYAGVQDGDPALCREAGLEVTGQLRVNKPGELDGIIGKWTGENYNCATVHVGWGMESDDEMDRLVSHVIDTSVKHHFPIYIETHRATITQDMQRTVALTRRFPEVRFNGDFSHWYTGLEMVNGSIEDKWAFMAPVFERVRFIHGRIGNPGSIQVDIGDGKNRVYVDHFREMWTRSFQGFLRTARPGDYISFTPELLSPEYYYARTISGKGGSPAEEGDRWQQALLYKELARQCWQEALDSIGKRT